MLERTLVSVAMVGLAQVNGRPSFDSGWPNSKSWSAHLEVWSAQLRWTIWTRTCYSTSNRNIHQECWEESWKSDAAMKLNSKQAPLCIRKMVPDRLPRVAATARLARGDGRLGSRPWSAQLVFMVGLVKALWPAQLGGVLCSTHEEHPKTREIFAGISLHTIRSVTQWI